MKHNISNLELYKPINRYIYRQDDPVIASLRYGRLGKRIEKVGCALVAIFNVMRHLGSEDIFPQTALNMQELPILPNLRSALTAAEPLLYAHGTASAATEFIFTRFSTTADRLLHSTAFATTITLFRFLPMCSGRNALLRDIFYRRLVNINLHKKGTKYLCNKI